jgi:hypothetical protein
MSPMHAQEKYGILINILSEFAFNGFQMKLLSENMLIICGFGKITNTAWLMGTGGSMPHSQGLSNNPYPQPG